MEIIQCPNCSGHNLNVVANGTYQCKDCGTMFTGFNTQPQTTIIKYVTANGVESPNGKSKIAAGILGILLGAFGVHKFYLGEVALGILYLFFFWTFIPGLIGLIEGIVYLCESDEEFAMKHGGAY